MVQEVNAFRAWFTPDDRRIREVRGYQTVFFAVWVIMGALAFIVFSSVLGYVIAVIGASMVFGKRDISRNDTRVMLTLVWVEAFVLFGRILVYLDVFPVALALFIAGVLAIWMRGVEK